MSVCTYVYIYIYVEREREARGATSEPGTLSKEGETICASLLACRPCIHIFFIGVMWLCFHCSPISSLHKGGPLGLRDLTRLLSPAK